jgi:hypothetical protein
VLKAQRPAPLFFISPTVVIEILALIKDTKKPLDLRKAAEAGFRSLKGHGFDIIKLNSSDDAIAKGLGDDLRYAQLIPYGEVNDARIIGEAAAANCDFLTTDDAHIADIDQEAMRRILSDKHVHPLRILRPHQIIRALRKR